MIRSVPANTQLSGTPPVSRKSTGAPSGSRMSTPPDENVVIQSRPRSSIFRPSGMWPSGSRWIIVVVPSGRVR
jgi:hypothetical protein